MTSLPRDSDDDAPTPTYRERTSARRLRLTAMLVPLACVALYGCPTAQTDDDDAAGTPAGYEDVLYEGGTTDEALIALAAALDQGAPQPDTSQAPLLVGPMGELPSEPVPTFTWKLGSSARAPTQPDGLRWAGSWPPDGHRWDWTPNLAVGDERLRRAPRPWAGLLGLRSAHAHGDPFSGYGVLLTISSSSDPKLCRVFTGATSYSPSAEVWDKIVAAGEVTVALVGAAFENNRIPAASGPYLGSTTTLTITSAPQ